MRTAVLRYDVPYAVLVLLLLLLLLLMLLLLLLLCSVRTAIALLVLAAMFSIVRTACGLRLTAFGRSCCNSEQRPLRRTVMEDGGWWVVGG